MLFIFRCLGFFLMFLACCALGWELAILAETRVFNLSTLGELWHSLDPDSLALYQATVEQRIATPLWDKLLAPLLHHEAVVVFAIPGLGFAWLPWVVRLFKGLDEPEMA